MASSKHDKLENICDWLSSHNFSLLNEVSDDLKCGICGNVLVNACRADCGCKFCKGCIDTYSFEEGSFCPGPSETCRVTDITNMGIDEEITESISRLPVGCNEEQCGHHCQLMNVERHFEDCLRRKRSISTRNEEIKENYFVYEADQNRDSLRVNQCDITTCQTALEAKKGRETIFKDQASNEETAENFIDEVFSKFGYQENSDGDEKTSIREIERMNEVELISLDKDTRNENKEEVDGIKVKGFENQSIQTIAEENKNDIKQIFEKLKVLEKENKILKVQIKELKQREDKSKVDIESLQKTMLQFELAEAHREEMRYLEIADFKKLIGANKKEIKKIKEEENIIKNENAVMKDDITQVKEKGKNDEEVLKYLKQHDEMMRNIIDKNECDVMKLKEIIELNNYEIRVMKENIDKIHMEYEYMTEEVENMKEGKDIIKNDLQKILEVLEEVEKNIDFIRVELKSVKMQIEKKDTERRDADSERDSKWTKEMVKVLEESTQLVEERIKSLITEIDDLKEKYGSEISLRVHRLENDMGIRDGMFIWPVGAIDKLEKFKTVSSEYFFDRNNLFKMQLQLIPWFGSNRVHVWLMVHNDGKDVNSKWFFNANVTIRIADQFHRNKHQCLTKHCIIEEPVLKDFGRCDIFAFDKLDLSKIGISMEKTSCVVECFLDFFK